MTGRQGVIERPLPSSCFLLRLRLPFFCFFFSPFRRRHPRPWGSISFCLCVSRRSNTPSRSDTIYLPSAFSDVEPRGPPAVPPPPPAHNRRGVSPDNQRGATENAPRVNKGTARARSDRAPVCRCGARAYFRFPHARASVLMSACMRVLSLRPRRGDGRYLIREKTREIWWRFFLIKSPEERLSPGTGWAEGEISGRCEVKTLMSS